MTGDQNYGQGVSRTNIFDGVSVSFQLPMAEGWLCPRCKRVNSPMMMQCNCPAQAASQPANTDGIFISGVSASISGNLSVSGSATYAEDVQITLT